MAKPKVGLEYYSVQTNRYLDPKIKRLKKLCKAEGVSIYDFVLCEIYREKGYFLKVDDDYIFDVAEYWNMEESRVMEIIDTCCSVGLFNQKLYQSDRLLSACSIITRYIDWSKKAKRIVPKIHDKMMFLLEECDEFSEESAHSPEESGDSPEETTHSTGSLPQSKEVKEVKKPLPVKPAPNKSAVKKLKKEEEPEPFWKELVKVWFDFGKKKFGEEPTFGRDDPKIFKRILHRLIDRANKKGHEWNVKTGPEKLSTFLDAAFEDAWLSKNFLLSNLEKQFDKVIQNQNEKNKKRETPGPQLKGLAATLDYLLGRINEGAVVDHLILPEYYDTMSARGMVPVGFMKDQPGETVDEKKKAAVMAFLVHQQNQKEHVS